MWHHSVSLTAIETNLSLRPVQSFQRPLPERRISDACKLAALADSEIIANTQGQCRVRCQVAKSMQTFVILLKSLKDYLGCTLLSSFKKSMDQRAAIEYTATDNSAEEATIFKFHQGIE